MLGHLSSQYALILTRTGLVFFYGRGQNLDPRSMDHLFGQGPWTTSLDRVHGPPIWIGSMDPLIWTGSVDPLFFIPKKWQKEKGLDISRQVIILRKTTKRFSLKNMFRQQLLSSSVS